MKDRVKELRKALNLTQLAFGERLGVKGNTIGNYETGNRVPTNQVITSICREWNVNEEWLRTGNGSMFVELSQAELAARAVGNLLKNDSEFVQNTMIALGSLSTDDWEKVEKFVNQCFREG